MAALSKVADVLQKSVAFTCMAASVYLLVFTGRNYLALREKRLANAAIIASQKEREVSSESAVVPGQEDTSPKHEKGTFFKIYISSPKLIWGPLS